MTGIAPTLRALRHGEETMAAELVAVAERHHAEHEVVHVALDLARWSRENAERLCGAEGRYGGVPGPGAQPGDIHAGTLTALADSPAPPDADEGTLLLHGLRHLHLRAAENSLYWQTLAQAGQALRDRRLLNLTSECHPRSLRQMRWTTTMIKNLAPQLLTVPAEPS